METPGYEYTAAQSQGDPGGGASGIRPEAVLKQYFGHSEFRSGQRQVVDAILSGRDALCVMPTGAGKSVCYQVPAMILPGVTLVVSPLISLMKDQVNALTQNGIRAAYLNSSLTSGQYARAIANIRRGEYKIIYVAPERLAVTDFLDVCRDLRIDLLAIDEAHCISQWGQDFRPSYLRITEFLDALAIRPTVAAFTATATAEVKDDIEASLGLRSPFRITTGFDRPNLKLGVIRSGSKLDDLLGILAAHRGDSGIIYCATRRTVEELTERLCRAGIPATMYHAGLADEVRKCNQEDFVYDRSPVMVATNAFGMGIDKSNVSYVIHYNMPKDIESYYQEAGRAGRDGSAADCILLYSPADVHTNQFLIERSEPNPDLTPEEQEVLRARDYERLKQMTFYSTVNTCLRAFILDYFGEKAPGYCGSCSNCLTRFREVDITSDAVGILSCIRETGGRYGKKMIVDILRGSKSEKLLRSGLNRRSAYGLLAERKETEVRSVIDHLEFEGYIETVGTEYPTLALTPRAEELLCGNETLTMKQAEPREPTVRRTKGKAKAGAGAAVQDHSLLAALKALRRSLADEKHVPAYVVFSDATLIDMCKRRPGTPEELLEVSGVGMVKLSQYGEAFLALLRRHPAGDGDETE